MTNAIRKWEDKEELLRLTKPEEKKKKPFTLFKVDVYRKPSDRDSRFHSIGSLSRFQGIIKPLCSCPGKGPTFLDGRLLKGL